MCVKVYGMCHPNVLVFHKKTLDMGPILVKGILIKSAVLREKDPNRNGSRLAKIKKKKKKNTHTQKKTPVKSASEKNT